MATQLAPPQTIGPILLRPIFQERIWGVDALPHWYPQPASGKRIGEAWLTAETCIADSGPNRGRTLAELAAHYPAAFGDPANLGFPLLIKLLFPREKLSVQVHPDDIQARAMNLPRGKTECWYILSADPGAQVTIGFREPLSHDQIRSAIEDNTLEDKLRGLPVKAGDMVYVDAGTVHSTGPGIVVLETQQYCDITYRLYDYGRPRELHLEAALAASRTSTAAGLVAPVAMDGFVRLVSSPYFDVDRFTLPQDLPTQLGSAHKMQMLVALGDGCAVETAAGDNTTLPPGWTVILPAEGIEYRLRGAGEVIRIAQP